MPPAQQQALAKQYGIDLGALAGSGAGATGLLRGRRGRELTPAQRPLGADGQLIDPFNPFARDLQAEEDAEEEAAAALVIEPLDPAERFGLGFFAAEVSTFAPVDNAPVPQDYRLGPGDELNMLMLGQVGGVCPHY